MGGDAPFARLRGTALRGDLWPDLAPSARGHAPTCHLARPSHRAINQDEKVDERQRVRRCVMMYKRTVCAEQKNAVTFCFVLMSSMTVVEAGLVVGVTAVVIEAAAVSCKCHWSKSE